MSNLEILYQKFTDQQYINSQFDEEGELNVLFVNPTLSGNNFYKMILPSVLLKNLEDVSTAVVGTQLFNVQAPFTTKDINLNSQQLLWADVIVFPFTTEPLHVSYAGLRTVNPAIRILYNVDFNCYEVPENHPYKKIFSQERLATIDTNIINADGVIVSNALLGEFLAQRIKRMVAQHSLKHTPSVRLLPLVGDVETMGGLSFPEAEEKKKGSKLKLLVIVSSASLEDFKTWSPLFKEVNKLPVELVVFGLTEANAEFRQTMKGIRYTSIPPTALLSYYDKLASVQPDMLLSIHLKSRFNELSGDYKKMIDAAVFNAPILTIHQYPYSSIVDNGKTGFLCKDQKDVLAQITSFAKDQNLLTPIKETVHHLLTEHFTDTPEYYQLLYKVFSE